MMAKRTIFTLAFALMVSHSFADTPDATLANNDEKISIIEDIVAAKKKDPATLQNLRAQLADENGDVRLRERAAWALGELRDAGAIPTLIEAAHHKSLLIRSAAMNSLVQLRALAAVPMFIDSAQNDLILTLRQRSTLALGILHAEKGIPTLATLSSDQREEIRGAAALALGAVHSKKNDATQILKEMKKDASPYVQERAQHALEGIRGTAAQLKAQMNSADPDIRLFAALHYAQRGKKSDLKFLTAAANSDADEDVRQELQEAVAAINKRAAAHRAPSKGKSGKKVKHAAK